LKNRGTKLLLIQAVKGTIIFSRGALAHQARWPKIPRSPVAGSWKNKLKRRAPNKGCKAASLSHDDEDGKGSKSKAKKSGKKTRSLSQVSIKDANKKKKLETFAAVPG
jgi:hypothetical protein